ncbi:MAG: Holliday junction resolvase RuvX [Defluviitaleaceae bacterium]|nr:Holliday junction resolvase RuvX [Defluviitaleaceae bacterium]
MKTLGLDLGDKTLGIAMSDSLGMVAHGIETFTFKTAHYKHALEYLVNFLKKEDISTIVLGMPKNMDNTIGERAHISQRFAKKVEIMTGRNVVLWDERLTTTEANRVLIAGGVRRENRKDHLDQLAATLILQSYLDRQQHDRSFLVKTF